MARQINCSEFQSIWLAVKFTSVCVPSWWQRLERLVKKSGSQDIEQDKRKTQSDQWFSSLDTKGQWTQKTETKKNNEHLWEEKDQQTKSLRVQGASTKNISSWYNFRKEKNISYHFHFWQTLQAEVLETDWIITSWDFPDGPVVIILCCHCRGHRLNPWSGN